MANIGIPGLILILVIALIVFGPSKLPEIGKAVGGSLREFKKATTDLVNDTDDKKKLDQNQDQNQNKNS